MFLKYSQQEWLNLFDTAVLHRQIDRYRRKSFIKVSDGLASELEFKVCTLQSGIDVPPRLFIFSKNVHQDILIATPPLINFEPRGHFPNQTKNCPEKVTRCECLLC